jgi:hypothetical protein
MAMWRLRKMTRQLNSEVVYNFVNSFIPHTEQSHALINVWENYPKKSMKVANAIDKDSIEFLIFKFESLN